MNYRIADVRDVLRNGDFDVFAHGVNCQGGFSSGIARVIRDVIPDAKAAYHKYQDKHFDVSVDGANLLGKVCQYNYGDGKDFKSILHCFTQQYYGRGGQKYGSYDAVDQCFKTISRRYFDTPQKISFPLIGCGLANLDWKIVSTIIDSHLEGKVEYECILRWEDVKKYGLLQETAHLMN